MTMLLLLISLLGDEAQLAKMLASRSYLDAARLLHGDAHQLVSPESVRRYCVLVVEYHSRQLAFRNFFVNNLAAGERLRLLRGSEQVVSGPNTSLVEEDMEVLLERAWKKFPDDPDIRFARAVYVFNGTCCFIEPKIHLTHTEIIAAFRAGETRGIRCGSSVWALALEEMAGKNPDRELLKELLEKAHLLRGDDPNIYLAYINDLLVRAEFQLALPHARRLYELALTPTERVDSLTVVARAYAGQEKNDKVMEAVKAGLNINGQHSLLWMIGLECLREKKDRAAYRSLLAGYLDQSPEKPSLFRGYLDYIRRKGLTEMDELFLTSYQARTDGTPLARITRHANLADYYLWLREWDKAVAQVAAARALTTELKEVHPGMTEILDAMEEAARKH